MLPVPGPVGGGALPALTTDKIWKGVASVATEKTIAEALGRINCKARQTTPTDFTAGGIWYTLALDAADVWNNGSVGRTPNTRLTIPTGGDGFYLLAGVVAFATSVLGTYRAARMLINGLAPAPVIQHNMVPVNLVGGNMYVPLFGIERLVATDYVEIQGIQDAVAGLDSYAADCWLSATLLGNWQ